MRPVTRMSFSRPSTRTVAVASSVSPPSSRPCSIWSRTPSSISRCAVTPSFFRNFRTDRLKVSSSIAWSVRDQALAGELALGLGEGDVTGREYDVRLDELVVAKLLAVARHQREHLLPELVEGVLLAPLDRLDRAVVELVQAVGVFVRKLVLTLARDADDHHGR